ncbi:MAG: serine protease [Microgenomates group bacterium]
MAQKKICIRKTTSYGILFLVLCVISTFVFSFLANSMKLSTKSRASTPKSNPAIIGGRTAAEGEFPYMVFMYHKDKLIYDAKTGKYDLFTNKALVCGGVVIKNSWIMTAAHCVEKIKKYESVGLAVGVTKLIGTMTQETYDKTFYSIQDIQIHPDYASAFDVAPFDLALIQTTAPMNVSATPLLPSTSLEDKLYAIDNSTTIAGYGIYQYVPWLWIFTSGVYPKELQTINLPIVSGPDKNPLKIGYVDEKKGRQNTSDKGDSGGPVLFTYNGTVYVIGILSDNYGPVYGPHISSHLDWITKIIGQ